MTYNNDLSWEDLSRIAGNNSNNVMATLGEGKRQYDEWQSFRAGRTNAQIATALARTEAEVAEMDACFAAMLALFNYGNNGVPTQSDYFFSLRKFS